MDLHDSKLAQDSKYKMSKKDELESTKKSLSSEIEVMITKHKKERESVEQQIWDMIDEEKEKNKEELAKAIDNAMK